MFRPLSELCEIRTGYQFRKGVGDEVADVPAVGVIQLRDIDNGCVNFGGIDHARIKSPGKYLVKSGDVLFLARGHRFTATPLENVPPDVIATHFFVILRPHRVTGKRTILPEFLAWSLNHPRTQEQFKGIARQTHIPFVSTSEIREHRLELPRLDIQMQVVDLDSTRRREDELTRRLLEKRTQFVDEVTWQLVQDADQHPL